MTLLSSVQGDELPYGWDEAVSEDKRRFYINHIDNRHYLDHPRDALNRQQASVPWVKCLLLASCQPCGLWSQLNLRSWGRSRVLLSTAAVKQL